MFILKQRFRWQAEQTNLPNRNHRLRYVLPEYDGFRCVNSVFIGKLNCSEWIRERAYQGFFGLLGIL